MKELKQAFRAVNNPESSAGPKAEVDLPVVELNNRCLKSKKVDLFSSHKKNFIAAIFFFFFLFWHLNIFFRKTRGVFVGSGCGLLRPTPSHDRPWWEGQGAERLQSHSRIWPLTGGLHVGRGRLGHTYTDFTLGECFTFWQSVHGWVCVECIFAKQNFVHGGSHYLVSALFSFLSLLNLS